MRVGFVVNTLLSGLVVLAVWLLDYHYVRRLSKKLSGSSLQAFQAASKLTKAVAPAFPLTGVDLDDFYYLPDDTIYVEMFNFNTPNSTVGIQIAKLFVQAYGEKLAGMHRVRVYIKSKRLKKNQEVSLDDPSPFQNSHLGSQAFYYLRIVQGERNDELKMKGNVLTITASLEQMTSLPFCQAVVGRSIYLFKRLGKLRGLKTDAPLTDRLNQVYLARLRIDFGRHVDALGYINSNKNLVFLDQYKAELEKEAGDLQGVWKSQRPLELWGVVEKKDLAIYTTVYMFEEY
jgi:hypothetical protein